MVGAEGQTVAEEHPLDADDADQHEALHHDGEDVLAAHQPAIEEREPGSHQHHEGRADDHPSRVPGVHIPHGVSPSPVEVYVRMSSGECSGRPAARVIAVSITAEKTAGENRQAYQAVMPLLVHLAKWRRVGGSLSGRTEGGRGLLVALGKLAKGSAETSAALRRRPFGQPRARHHRPDWGGRTGSWSAGSGRPSLPVRRRREAPPLERGRGAGGAAPDGEDRRLGP